MTDKVQGGLKWLGRLYVLVLVGLCALTVSWLSLDVHSGAFEREIRTGGLKHLDFVRFYAMGKLSASPDRLHVYDAQTQLDWVNAVIYPASRPHVLYMEYPPWAFLPLIALAYTRLDIAYIGWSVLSVVAACGGAFVLRRCNPELRAGDAAVLMLAACGSYVAFNCLVAGQLAMFLLLLLSLFFWALRGQRNWLGGCVLGLISIKLQYLPFLLIPLVVLKRWRMMVSYAVAQAALLAAAGLWFGWASIAAYPQSLLSSETHVGLVYNSVNSMVSLRGLLAPLVSKQASAYFGFVTMACGLALTWWLWRAERDRERRWSMALTPLIAIVFCPHSYLYDVLVLAVSAALTLPSFSLRRLAGLTPPAYRMWAFVLAIYPAAGWFLPVQETGTYFLSFLIVNVLLLVLGLRAFWIAGSSEDACAPMPD